jgi:hypothetical protein
MANVDNPRGLKPLRTPGGGDIRLRKYAANVTTDVFQGDVVQMLASGRIATITTTTGSDKIVGVAANYIDASDSGTAQDIWVYDDPGQEFEIQDDGASATPSAAVVGATFAMVITTGNTTTGYSKHELDASAAGVAATDPLIVMGFKVAPDAEVGKFAPHIVKLNRHIWKTGSAGI